MSNGTKQEMTAEELIEKWPYKLEDFTDPLTGNLTHIVQPSPEELRADLRSVIRGKMMEYGNKRDVSERVCRVDKREL